MNTTAKTTNDTSKVKPKIVPKAKTEKAKPAAAPAPQTEAVKPKPEQAAAKPDKASAAKPAAKPEAKPNIKQRIIDMLNRADGATDAELVKEFGWKGNHVARGRRCNLAKEFKEKNKGILIGKFTRTPSGDTAYKIEKIEEAAEEKKAA